jgi:assimilatory nitrate reductase catalytic subunit
MDFTPDAIDRVRRFWSATRVATRPGLKAVELFDAVADGRIRAVWIMSTNPVVSMPDADKVRRALRACDFVVVSDCVRRTDTTQCANVLLPAAAWGEKSGTVTNSERRISRQRAFLPMPNESRPDWWIVCEVAKRLGFVHGFGFTGPADIFREHARLSAFENDGSRAFDIGSLADVSEPEYEELLPVQWPAPKMENSRAADGMPSGAAALALGAFFTADRKARFIPVSGRPPATAPSTALPFVLNTGRVRDHWHTLTRTGRSARLSQRHSEPFVQIHPDDAVRLALATGDLAQLSAPTGRMLARVDVTRDVRAGELFAPMHWSTQFANEARVGTLIAAAPDPVSGQPELKAGVVSVGRFAPRWHAFVLSVEPLTITDDCYRVAVKGVGHWRYELAGQVVPDSWPQWIRAAWGLDHEWIELADLAAGRYRAAALRAGRLFACVFASAAPLRDAREALASLFTDDPLDAGARVALLSGKLGTGRSDRGATICSCFSVGRNTLLAAIRSQRLTSTREIGAALRAGTNCGSCLPELNALLAESASRNGSAV